MNYFIDELCRILRQDQPLVMATVLSHQGSTPRGTGSRMLVLPGGEILGTIGGGRVEAEVIRTASALFDTQTSQIQCFDLSLEPNPDDLDVICGGRMTILVEYLDATAENIDVFLKLQTRLRQHQSSFLIASLTRENDDVRVGKRCLLQQNGTLPDNCPYAAGDLHQLVNEAGGTRIPILLSTGEQQYLMEPFFMAGTILILGAGHVAKQVAAVGRIAGFGTVVLDDREEFASPDRFPGADRILVLDTFDNAFERLDTNGNTYIVIVTRGHRHDQTVLSQALKTDAGYIGMIGSRKKRDAIYRNLLNGGFAQADIDRVHSPIGLEIGAETPEEIAVSIVAELILERSRRNKDQ